ncbi:MAG: hypothetical protein FD155_1797 [Bacteroidetes bacterium]|nr:MAG: hypothetical protein FD155_1797 [Bacteroidota bacterium]
MFEEEVRAQPLVPWFMLIVTDVPQAAESVIIPERALPGFAITFTFIRPLFEPDGGVTVTHDKDSDTVQLE